MAGMSVWNAGRAAVFGIALLATASGCTMCPDPHDYSGPVPGGSATQNDFRARSNGILPLGAAPAPWPPVVKASRQDADEPEAGTDAGPADAYAAAVADAEEPAAVVAVDADPEVADEPSAARPEGVEPASVEEPFPDILPPARSLRPERRPPLRESLGWKPRG